MSKAGQSWQERRWRRRVGEMLAEGGILRGSVSVRRRVCGKPNCRCTRGERHEAMFVVYRRANRTTQIYVPKAWEPRVREWVKRYGDVRELIEKLSGVYEAKARRRKE